MNTVLEFAQNMCFAAVGSAVLSFLLPKGNIAKTAKTVLGVFLIWVMFMPVASFFDIDIANSTELSVDEYYNNADLPSAAAEYTEKQIEYSIAKLLEKNNIEYKKIYVHSNIEKNGVININEIEVETGGNAEKIKELIFKETGITPTIITD